MFKLLLILATVTSFQVEAKLLDKIAGVINDKVFTLSELKRVQKTVPVRREIAPFIYKNSSYQISDILHLVQKQFVIKDKLAELGYVISDDAVESRIKDTEKSLGLSRSQLRSFLKSKNLAYNEYFELIREAMEFNVFNSRIIAPLVTITDQELKNHYYKLNSKNKALAFKYKIVDFTLDESKVRKSDLKNLALILESYKNTGNIPQIYNDISTNDLGEVIGDELPVDLNSLLKKTNEKSFTDAYIKGGIVHVFYIESKDLVESSEFLKARNAIYQKLFMVRSESLIQNWLSRESQNYYILENL